MSNEQPPEGYAQQPEQQQPEQPAYPQPEPEQPYAPPPMPPQPEPQAAPPPPMPQQPYMAPQMQQPMQPQVAAAGPGYDWTVTLILSILVGEFGVDRFYTGSIMLGILKLITFGGCGIWWLVDVILIVTGAYKDAYGRPLVRKL